MTERCHRSLVKQGRTGVLVLQNAQSLFRPQTLARTNYWAKLVEILHGTLQEDSAWDSRGVFEYSTWRPRNGVPLGIPRGVKNIENIFFSFFQIFQRKWVPGRLNS